MECVIEKLLLLLCGHGSPDQPLRQPLGSPTTHSAQQLEVHWLVVRPSLLDICLEERIQPQKLRGEFTRFLQISQLLNPCLNALLHIMDPLEPKIMPHALLEELEMQCGLSKINTFTFLEDKLSSVVTATSMNASSTKDSICIELNSSVFVQE
jgi:hypothetical protein